MLPLSKGIFKDLKQAYDKHYAAAKVFDIKFTPHDIRDAWAAVWFASTGRPGHHMRDDLQTEFGQSNSTSTASYCSILHVPIIVAPKRKREDSDTDGGQQSKIRKFIGDILSKLLPFYKQTQIQH
jgi:integrase